MDQFGEKDNMLDKDFLDIKRVSFESGKTEIVPGVYVTFFNATSESYFFTIEMEGFQTISSSETFTSINKAHKKILLTLKKMNRKNISAYPLSWPDGYTRSGRQEYNNRYKKGLTFAEARDSLLEELRLLNAQNIVISSNIPLRIDGLPKSSYKKINDTGVAVYFNLHKSSRVLCCDHWKSEIHNAWSIAKTVNAMRLISRCGVSEMLERAFYGFHAIPEKLQKTPYEFLGLNEYSTNQELLNAYRQLAKMYHPDAGGNSKDFQDLNEAWEQIKALRDIK